MVVYVNKYYNNYQTEKMVKRSKTNEEFIQSLIGRNVKKGREEEEKE